MFDDEKQEKLVEVFKKRFENYNTYVLEELGEVIKQFKDLIPSQAYKLAQQLKFNTTAKEMIKELARITKMSERDIEKVLEQVARENLGFAKVYYKAREMDVPIYEENKALQRLVKATSNIAREEFKNLSKSTGFALTDRKGMPIILDMEQTYQETIDRCVMAVAQGKETYQQTMRKFMKQLSDSGVRKIYYENQGKEYRGKIAERAYSQRIDTAIRRNVLDSVRELSNQTQMLFGKEFNSDGVEISVHENPAPDHEDVQGKQFSNKEFQKFQKGEIAFDVKDVEYEPIKGKQHRRAISQYNCYHRVFAILIGVSEPLYTDEQLAKIIENTHKEFEFKGHKYTVYEGTQLQRKIETRIR